MSKPRGRGTTALPTGAVISTSPADIEWDELTTALNDLGILHVAPGREIRTGLLDGASALFERLMISREARLQQASIFLLLTHPELAGAAREAIGHLHPGLRERAMQRYVAAAAMQRMARTRIEMQLGPLPDLRPAYLADLGLPALDEEFGRATLAALAQQEEALHGYDAWGTYSTLLELFLSEIRKSGWGMVCVNAPTAPA